MIGCFTKRTIYISSENTKRTFLTLCTLEKASKPFGKFKGVDCPGRAQRPSHSQITRIPTIAQWSKYLSLYYYQLMVEHKKDQEDGKLVSALTTWGGLYLKYVRQILTDLSPVPTRFAKEVPDMKETSCAAEGVST